MNYVDEFILLDDVQYTKRDWRNRNIIMTNLGAKWLTIPVKTKDKYLQLIREVKIDGNAWQGIHFETLRHQYSKYPGFEEYGNRFGLLYEKKYDSLLEVLVSFLEEVRAILKIDTPLTLSFFIPGRRKENR